MNYTAVITTINEPTKAIKEFAKRLPLIVIGDEKTPNDWSYHPVEYYNGNGLGFSYLPPINHYARKNIGYLLAIKYGADCIYDTDDDNIPNENWKLRGIKCEKVLEVINNGWINVYDAFTPYFIWPRGLPLTEINRKPKIKLGDDTISITSPIQQGLADKSPDVDAIWRLTNGQDVNFKYDRSIHLPQYTWSPFNSQSTWWFKEAFPLMYLPQYCSMRMTDIIRSFVAQRCLWEMGYGVVFHSPSEVIQERNEHDLMKDFEDEIQGYLMNDKIKERLDGISFGSNLIENMFYCYWELTEMKVLPKEELTSLKQWIADI